MRRALVAGNWKMNGSRASNQALIDGIKAGLEGANAEVAVCPPFVYIADVAAQLQGTRIAWGGQNLSDQEPGAFTGEVAGPMLADLGCTYAIVGHSERRTLYGEPDEIVARKFAAARRAGLKPILCVGELLEERETGVTQAVIDRQLEAVLALEGVQAFSEAVIAYEPVWAIGTGKTATPEQAQEVHAFIRGKIAALDGTIADRLQILYGGSVKASNANELFSMQDIDGGLIGGASLNAEEFIAICRAGG
jgi:triosephosphate isomerase (TIM)